MLKMTKFTQIFFELCKAQTIGSRLQFCYRSTKYPNLVVNARVDEIEFCLLLWKHREAIGNFKTLQNPWKSKTFAVVKCI